MEAFSAEGFAAVLALVGIVIVVAALLSGFIERSNIPQVGVFLTLGAVLGPSGLGLLNVTLDSPILRVVATLSLALVLFTDAVSLSISEVRRHAGLALLVLGPGTMLSAALIALAGWWLLGLAPAAAILLAAALASTDPVLLRGLLRRPDIPGDARQALRLESGLNDVVLLPIVLVAMIFLGSSHGGGEGGAGGTNWFKFALDLFILGPGAGVLIGLLGVATLDLVRRRVGIRRDYESIYSLGIAFASFAAAEAVHGSGFLAAFTAGMTIAALDVELCDCFLEYGETTAEMALLFTFVLLGASLIWSGFTVLTVASAVFALLVILIRPVAFLTSFAPTKLEKRSRYIIAWFGPRGLSSLLLVLLPVFAGTPGSDKLFSICCLVVVVSVALHGGSIMAVGRFSHPASHPASSPVAEHEQEPVPLPVVQTPPPALPVYTNGASVEVTQEVTQEVTLADAPEETPYDEARISIAEMERRKEAGEEILLLDVRKDRSYGASAVTAAGAVRLHPDHILEDTRKHNLSHTALLIAFCKCPDEETSLRVVGELREAGWEKARALTGGWQAWEAAGLPTEAKVS
jgi:NhaP-type Na+/H+ or K+/H+ antiporter/rhodanese-related sulfurtransferase